MMYKDETGKMVKAANYDEAAEKLYGQALSYSNTPTTYVHRRSGYAEVNVYKAGDKIGNYWGVAAAIPEHHKLVRVIDK